MAVMSPPNPYVTWDTSRGVFVRTKSAEGKVVPIPVGTKFQWGNTILTLKKDDFSRIPYFLTVVDTVHCEHLHKLTLYNPGPTIAPDHVTIPKATFEAFEAWYRQWSRPPMMARNLELYAVCEDLFKSKINPEVYNAGCPKGFTTVAYWLAVNAPDKLAQGQVIGGRLAGAYKGATMWIKASKAEKDAAPSTSNVRMYPTDFVNNTIRSCM